MACNCLVHRLLNYFSFIVLAFSVSAGVHAQEAVTTDQPPSVQQALAACRDFWKSWDSVQFTFRKDSLSYDPAAGAWQVYGHAQGQTAWNPTAWRTLTKDLYRTSGAKVAFAADYVEVAPLENGVLTVRGKGRTPTEEEVNRADFSAFESVGSQFRVTMREQSGSSTAAAMPSPQVALLTGSNWTGDGSNVLDIWSAAQAKNVDPIERLGRKCWQITFRPSGQSGDLSMIVCPELQWAPVELRTVLGVNDLHWSGKRVGDIEVDGGRMQRWESVMSLESVTADWSEFSIRTESTSTSAGGTRGGFGNLTHYQAVQRPADPDSFRVTSPIENGTPVLLMDSQQLKAEWQDGKIVRVYDGAVVEELAEVQMAPPQSSVPRIVAGIVAALGVIAAGWFLRKAGKRGRQNISGGK